MGWNMYLAPREGDGLTPETAFRSIFRRWPGVLQYSEIRNHSRMTSITFLEAPDAVHTAIQADPRVVRLFPVVSATLEQIRANLDVPLVSFGTSYATQLRAALEARGVDTDWAMAATTGRDLVRRLVRAYLFSQSIGGTNGTNALALLASNLDATVGSLSATVRNGAKSWLTAQGLDTSWIVSGTTVRQVLAWALGARTWPALALGEETF
jgi:hypothetical protein